MVELADALAYGGRLEAAENLIMNAMRLNPFYPDWYLWYLADIYFGMERYKDVVATIARMRDRSEGYRLLAAAHAMLGDLNAASEFGAKVMERQPGFSVSRWAAIQPDVDPGIHQRFVEALLKAGLPR